METVVESDDVGGSSCGKPGSWGAAVVSGIG